MTAVRFGIVGLIGAGVQLSALAVLSRALPGMLATALAVETAVLHNFLWHECWTWPGRPPAERMQRLWRFHVSNGIASVALNVAVTEALAWTGLPYLASNCVAIAAASIVNYVSADQFVFRHTTRNESPVFESHARSRER